MFFLTFGNKYIILIFGEIFYELSFVFLNMEGIMLKNNLIYAGRENEYVSIRNKSTTVYALVTAAIAFIASYLFNINSYLPMVLNIILCVICFLVSLTMKDITKNDKIPEAQIKQSCGKMSMIVYVAIISYAFFYTAVNIGQSNSKLFIQYQLSDYFDEQTTTIYFGMIIAMSRIARIISNLLFDKVYKKLKDKINVALSGVFIFAFVFIVAGDMVTSSVALKFGLMAIGFFIILSVRDPFKIYIQDLILRVTKPEEQQAIFAHLELARKIGQTAMGFVVSVTLLKVSMIWVIVGAGLISIMTLKTTVRLFKLVNRAKKLVNN